MSPGKFFHSEYPWSLNKIIDHAVTHFCHSTYVVMKLGMDDETVSYSGDTKNNKLLWMLTFNVFFFQ
jgi:hypothetical protein